MNQPNPQVLKDMVTTKMPFGKYKGTFISELPTYYLEWFHGKGFPQSKLGMLLQTAFVIKTEGLDELLNPLRKAYQKR